jgi:hypothetical protein
MSKEKLRNKLRNIVNSYPELPMAAVNKCLDILNTPGIIEPEKNEVADVLKSGNFTIIYCGSGYGEIIRGKFDDLDDLPKDKDEDYDYDYLKIRDFDSNERYGYLPIEVRLLVEALGGKAITN